MTELPRRHFSRLHIYVFLIFVISITGRAILLYLMSYHPKVDGTELLNVARSVAAGNGFADAYGPGTGPTAHAPPLYALLLGGIFRIFGAGSAGAWAQQVFGILICSAMYSLLPRMAVVCGLPLQAGLCAGFSMALLPFSFSAERGAFENVMTASLLLGLIAYSAVVREHTQLKFKTALAGGTLCGVMISLTPSTLFCTLGMLALGFWHFRRHARAFFRFAIVLSAVAIVIQLPWTIRNYLVLGAPLWSRSNFGLEFSMSNADGATPLADENYRSGWSGPRHPAENAVERAKLFRLGEVAYNRERMQEAKSWIMSHRAEFLRLTAARVFCFWLPPARRPIQTVLLGLNSCLALIGLILLLRRRAFVAYIAGTVMLTFPLVYYLIQTSPRYRYPLEPVLMLLAWSALLHGWERVRSARARPVA